ncbi:hypothetical protein LIER_19082 [Lithospermum erythrorhizon]|uniref:Retrotransposon gag domain-containing protein n=1 Tax=Lithospermum erythrorhizon TaxID=34254 RepID=A0AAV3QJ25_LITER
MNSMSKELSSGFMFASNASELWREIKEQFGGYSGPRIYELRRSIYSSKQGGYSVVVYYNKVKRLRDELACLRRNVVGQSYKSAANTGNDMNTRNFEGAKPVYKMREIVDKSHLKYDYHGKTRHVSNGCFMLVGFLEWWPKLEGYGRGKSNTVNNVAYQEENYMEGHTPLEELNEGRASGNV